VLNNVPSQLGWNWHREWKYFFDRKHPLCIEHKVVHGTAKMVDPRGSNRFFITSSPGSIGSYTYERESHQFTVKAIVQSGPNRGQLGRRIVNGHWYRSRTNWSLLLRDECYTQKGEHTAAIQLYK
jgi:hypothetical protein